MPCCPGILIFARVAIFKNFSGVTIPARGGAVVSMDSSPGFSSVLVAGTFGMVKELTIDLLIKLETHFIFAVTETGLLLEEDCFSVVLSWTEV